MTNRLPTETKKLQGTFLASREVEVISWAISEGIPEPSYPLSERGMEIWKDVCKDLKQVNLLRSRYSYELTNYCEWVDIYETAKLAWKESQTVIYTNKAGFENEQLSVHYKIMREALEVINEIGRQFGFTASSAERIRLKEQAPRKSKLAERISKKIDAA
jgi:P27 family predicted phage terminase small subunit